MKHTAAKVNALFQVSKKIGSDFELQEMLDFIITQAVDVFEARTGSLMLLEKVTSRLIMRSVIGLKADVVRTMKLKLGEGVTGQCALLGKPFLVRDTNSEPLYVEAVVGTRAEMAVPLKYQGKTFGVINLDSDRVGAFTKQDIKLLAAFASWAALAIRLKLLEKNFA